MDVDGLFSRPGSRRRGSRHRVVATFCPRVAAAQPPRGEPGALHGTVDGDGLQRVRRAGGV